MKDFATRVVEIAVQKALLRELGDYKYIAVNNMTGFKRGVDNNFCCWLKLNKFIN